MRAKKKCHVQVFWLMRWLLKYMHCLKIFFFSCAWLVVFSCWRWWRQRRLMMGGWWKVEWVSYNISHTQNLAGKKRLLTLSCKLWKFYLKNYLKISILPCLGHHKTMMLKEMHVEKGQKCIKSRVKQTTKIVLPPGEFCCKDFLLPF